MIYREKIIISTKIIYIPYEIISTLLRYRSYI